MAFLKFKSLRTQQAEDLVFSEDELAKLDRRWEEYEADPEFAIDAADFKIKVKMECKI